MALSPLFPFSERAHALHAELDRFVRQREPNGTGTGVFGVLEQFVDEMRVVRVEIGQQVLDSVFKVIFLVGFYPFPAFRRQSIEPLFLLAGHGTSLPKS